MNIAALFLSLLLLACVQCAPHKALSPSLVRLDSLARKQNAPSEFGGNCDVYLRGKKVRAQARILHDSTGTGLVLIDEMGVPLAQVMATKDKIDVQRIFPPFSSTIAAQAGTAFRAYCLVRIRNLAGTDTCAVRVSNQTNATLFASNGMPDSLCRPIRDACVKWAVYDGSTYTVMQPNADTVLIFRPQ